jgi:hypothetical protein
MAPLSRDVNVCVFIWHDLPIFSPISHLFTFATKHPQLSNTPFLLHSRTTSAVHS